MNAQPSSSDSRRSTSGQPTLVASGARLKGEVMGETDVIVEGQVVGTLSPKQDVMVQRGGKVKGTIRARRVRIAGEVEGNVQGADMVEIQPSGRLIGDVVAPSVVISDGAFFKGSVEMTGGAPVGASVAAAQGAAR